MAFDFHDFGDGPRPFVWGVWTSISSNNFKRMAEHWESPRRETEPPYFGWLCTSLPLYPETLLLKTNVHSRPIGHRPFIELEPTDHPLAIEQRNGITMDRVREIAEVLLHSDTKSLGQRTNLNRMFCGLPFILLAEPLSFLP